MRLLLFVLCLSALGAGSYAALARATPPPADIVRQPLAPGPGEKPRPVVRTRVTTETYAVSGQTAGEVLASMAESGPRPGGEVFFGLTVAEIGLRYRAVPEADGCALASVDVDLALTVTLPDWAPHTPPEAGLVRDWGRFRRALAGHEARHREIAETGADSIAGSLDGLRRASCAATTAEAHRRLARLEAAIRTAQHRYDDETDHGRTEGATWPPKRRAPLADSLRQQPG